MIETKRVRTLIQSKPFIDQCGSSRQSVVTDLPKRERGLGNFYGRRRSRERQAILDLDFGFGLGTFHSVRPIRNASQFTFSSPKSKIQNHFEAPADLASEAFRL